MDGPGKGCEEGREAIHGPGSELEHRRGLGLSDLRGRDGQRRARVGAVHLAKGEHESTNENRGYTAIQVTQWEVKRVAEVRDLRVGYHFERAVCVQHHNRCL